MRIEPRDAAQRERIASDHASTLFVRAGAGSGKTTSLVDRVVGLIEDAELEILQLGAITFTKKAAAELRYRLRAKLLARLDVKDANAKALQGAIDNLASANIGTIHSFAQRLLEGWGTAIGLPMVFSVMEEVASRIYFEGHFGNFMERCFTTPSSAELLGWLLDLDLRATSLRDLAYRLDQSTEVDLGALVGSSYSFMDIQIVKGQLLAIAKSLVEVPTMSGCGEALGKGDSLALRMQVVANTGRELIDLIDQGDLSAAVGKISNRLHPHPPSFKVGNVGKKGNWPSTSELADAREAVVGCGEQIQEFIEQFSHDLIAAAISLLAGFLVELRARRVSEGLLTYSDLLINATRLVESASGALMAEIRSHYRVLLVDEFQDTDPLQLRLIRAVVDFDDDYRPASENQVAPLFFVGDPRQSIYRFRGADIDSYLGVASVIPAEDQVTLTVNFRSKIAITEWINQCFGVLFGAVGGVEHSGLFAVRDCVLQGAEVWLIGSDSDKAKIANVGLRRHCEAGLVTSAILQMIDEGFEVEDAGVVRKMRLGDIAILVPDRGFLDALLGALASAGIKYSASNTTSLYSEPLIRDLFLVFRAASRPFDDKAWFNALRSPLLGVSAQALFDFSQSHRSLYRAIDLWRNGNHALGASVDVTLLAGLSVLEDIYRKAQVADLTTVVEFTLGRLTIRELAASLPNVDEVWRRIDLVIAQAKSYGRQVSPSLHSWVDFVFRHEEERGKVTESEGADIGTDSLRVMTIHGAKGLEFPIVILTGMSSFVAKSSASRVLIKTDVGAEFALNSDLKSQNFVEASGEEDIKDRQERIRLLYVGATRARDHLIITIPATATEVAALRTRAAANLVETLDGAKQYFEVITSACSTEVQQLPLALGVGGSIVSRTVRGPVNPGQWLAQRQQLIASSRLTKVVTPSAVAALVVTNHKAFLGDSPIQTNLSGLLLGNLVHECLAFVDLGDHELASSAAASYLTTKGLSSEVVDEVLGYIGHALDAPSVRACTFALREFFLGVSLGGDAVLESVLDLAYERPDGYHIVDYKVVFSASDEVISERMKSYRIQGALYRKALQQVFPDRIIASVTFVFLFPGGFREVPCPEVAESELESLISRYLAS